MVTHLSEDEGERARLDKLRLARVMLGGSIGIFVVWAVIDYRSLIGSLVYGYLYISAIGLVIAPVALLIEWTLKKRAASRNSDDIPESISE